MIALCIELNVHRSVIHRLWNHYQRIKTPVEDVGLDAGESPQRQTIATCCNVPEDTNSATAGVAALLLQGRPISCQIVSHRLHEGGMFARRPVACMPLSPAQVRAPLHWAREHRSWTPEQWGHVLFTDESRFNIQNDSRRAIIWRKPGTRYREPNIVARDNYRGGGLLVLAAIATNGRTDLYVFAGGSVTADRHRDEILHPLVWPFIAAMGIDAIFMGDNARPHGARLLRSYLESETVPQMA
ncbi:hypothetical protein AVEN_26283-1 [Araneus ventricosus]|uniref:Transposase Tc1-like domain-containing protein n=1 Tax=Araneus ventricosus TaxID=182803 RepID=A0A4Y2ALT4_ARAVE|nr:hypothetical protein AVEN_26283-1 [Araneus ventricosus]